MQIIFSLVYNYKGSTVHLFWCKTTSAFLFTAGRRVRKNTVYKNRSHYLPGSLFGSSSICAPLADQAGNVRPDSLGLCNNNYFQCSVSAVQCCSAVYQCSFFWLCRISSSEMALVGLNQRLWLIFSNARKHICDIPG